MPQATWMHKMRGLNDMRFVKRALLGIRPVERQYVVFQTLSFQLRDAVINKRL